MGLLFFRFYMNNTKKLTTGAMLLAIVGALMLIDRQLSFMFETIIIMFMPVIIIMYASMYELKDGVILAVCLLFLTFILGNPEYAFINVPIAVVVGLGYSYGVKKNFNKRKLMIIAMILFIIGEVIVTFIVTPLLGISIKEQLELMNKTYADVLPKMGYSMSALDQFGVNLSNLLLVIYVLSTLLVGVMEGFIIHVISLFLLNRFKIKEVEAGSIISINLSPTTAYMCMALFASMGLIRVIDNETVKLLIISVSMIGALILSYYGYLFCTVLIRMKFGKGIYNLLLIIVTIFLLPTSLLILIFIGFLYGVGPLKRYISKKTEVREQQ